MTYPLRPGLPALPHRIAALPIGENGYPVPWFVARIDGKPEFRVADDRKRRAAILQGLCWVCGQPLGRHLVFVVGPMCVVNRVSAEPPCHLDCAEFSVRACPFLSKPQMVRRENDMPEGTEVPAGEMIRRNPGVIALYPTRDFHLIRDGKGGVLLSLGAPERVTWWTQGRPATRAEAVASMTSGLPILMQMAEAEGADAVAELHRLVEAAQVLLPKE